MNHAIHVSLNIIQKVGHAPTSTMLCTRAEPSSCAHDARQQATVASDTAYHFENPLVCGIGITATGYESGEIRWSLISTTGVSSQHIHMTQGFEFLEETRCVASPRPNSGEYTCVHSAHVSPRSHLAEHAVYLCLLTSWPAARPTSAMSPGKNIPCPRLLPEECCALGYPPATTVWAGDTIASRRQTWAQIPQPVHSNGLISALHLSVLAYVSGLACNAGHPTCRHTPHATQRPRSTYNGWYAARTCGINAHSRRATMTEGSSTSRQARTACSTSAKQ